MPSSAVSGCKNLARKCENVRICFGQYDETPEEIVQEFQDALLAAGCQEVIDELQRQIDETYKAE